MTDTTSGTPLSAPLYGATFGQAIARFFKKYATFSGRASRSEFWWFFLFATVIYLVLNIAIARAVALLEWHLSPHLRRAPDALPGLDTPLELGTA